MENFSLQFFHLNQRLAFPCHSAATDNAFGVANINTEMERLAETQRGKNSVSDRLQTL